MTDDRIEALKRYGTDAVSFQGLESAMHWWRDAPPPDGTGAAIAYVDTGGAWLTAGSPLVDAARRGEAARRFIAAARSARRRAAFVCVEDVAAFDGQRLKRLPLGLQSVLLPSQWDATLRAKPRLREQLRRARAKGVTVRRVDATELAEDTPLRRRIEEVQQQWLDSRHMEPMAFLVSVEPFHAPHEHIYLVAERHGIVIQFLSAIPIYAREGWLMEDMLRTAAAPNGTTELLIDRLMREVGERARFITPGLTPLAGRMPWWLALARASMRPLYDFAGLERFRSRLSPPRWDPVWLLWDRGPAPLALFDALKAFSGGALMPFAWRSIVRHPSGPPWALGLPLIPWTMLLAMLTMAGRASWFGFSQAALAAWTIFDALLAWLLFRAANKPTRRRIAIAAAAAAIDAVLSLQHLITSGIGSQDVSVFLRLVSTLAPIAGCSALLWALHQTSARARAHVSEPAPRARNS